MEEIIMSFGENLQYYRKREEITQEQLAERMEVSRQTISKWEAGTSYPEMEKIMQLCDMFSCSMDTLLRKDAQAEVVEDSAQYEEHMKRFGKAVTAGVGILIIGGAFSTLLEGMNGLWKALQDIVMFPFLIVAVLTFVVAGIRHSEFTKRHPYILPFYTEEEKVSLDRSFPIKMAAGIGILLMSIVVDELQKFLPSPAGVEASAFYSFLMLLLISAGVMLLVHSGMEKSKYNIEEYNKEHDPLYRERLTPEQQRILDEESHMPLAAKWSACIMIVTTAIYLLWSFLQNAWQISWVLFPVGGLFCGIAYILLGQKK
ncbi:XRE family transcriptional regulator [Blautia producta]|uniref:XRE family transcriptional regulator n=3 Tax=Blautia producta TaxID=33035 RepID=A0A7G5MYV8_9FIRM|nr:XRE family transcriptional regulator [Blautia producta]